MFRQHDDNDDINLSHDVTQGDLDEDWHLSLRSLELQQLSGSPSQRSEVLPSSQLASLCPGSPPPPPLPNLPPLPLSSSPERRRLHPAKSATPNSPKVPPTPPQCTTPLPPTPQEKIPPIHLRGMNPTSTCT